MEEGTHADFYKGQEVKKEACLSHTTLTGRGDDDREEERVDDAEPLPRRLVLVGVRQLLLAAPLGSVGKEKEGPDGDDPREAQR